jgi:hypothetical protein
MQIARIRLSDRTSRLHPRWATSKLHQAYESDAVNLLNPPLGPGKFAFQNSIGANLTKPVDSKIAMREYQNLGP